MLLTPFTPTWPRHLIADTPHLESSISSLLRPICRQPLAFCHVLQTSLSRRESVCLQHHWLMHPYSSDPNGHLVRQGLDERRHERRTIPTPTSIAGVHIPGSESIYPPVVYEQKLRRLWFHIVDQKSSIHPMQYMHR